MVLFFVVKRMKKWNQDKKRIIKKGDATKKALPLFKAGLIYSSY
jgi:hypothetical protein